MADDGTRHRKWLDGLRKQIEPYRGKGVAVTERCDPYTRNISRTYALGIVIEYGNAILEEGRWTFLNVGKRHRKIIVERGTITDVRKIDDNIPIEQNMIYGFDKNGVNIVLPRDVKQRGTEELEKMAAELEALKTPARAV